MDDIKDKIVYLYLDNKTMTGYVGETKELEVRDGNHKKYDIMYDAKYPGRSTLMNNTDPVPLTDLLSKKEAWFVEHSLYEKYKEKGYDMLQKPPHPNLWERNKDKINNCKICDELGCNFTKERLEYILAVHRVSKLCPECNKPFYYDPVKHNGLPEFDKRIYCSRNCYEKNKSVGSYNVSKLCEYCNKPFSFDRIRHQFLSVFDQKRFCSRGCATKGRYNTGSINISKLCPACNKPFYPRKGQALTDFNKQKSCSIYCNHKIKRSSSYNVSKLCLTCNEPFYFDIKKHCSVTIFNKLNNCSKSCGGYGRWNSGDLIAY
jgi:hypothetical protein